MAARLTIVVSQTANRSPAMTDLEETLVAELIMTPGMDATMVGPVERIQSEDTDFLCVSSFNYSFVLLSWLDTQELAAEWTRLGLAGEVVALENEQSVSDSDAAKKILHWRLTENSNVSKIVAKLKELLGARQTKVVPLSISPIAPAVISRESDQEKSSVSKEASNDPQSIEKAPNVPPPAGQVVELESEATVSDSQAQSLDQLVDDFDALDL